ncbi:MAG TPA: long-chain fatty acid--CoA ligase [Anaerolineales bacterium]|nr:long-chain fatty acid--CoA ligase [Anaerolineales bacterium]
MDEKPWLKYYDPPVPPTLAPYPDLPLHHFLEESARKYPDQTCTIFHPHTSPSGAKITYRQMNDRADQLAAGLASLGVKKGQTVGIMMPNIPQFIMAYYAILKAGGVVVAINPTYTPRELEKPLNDAGIELVLVMSRFYDVLNQARPNSRIKTVVVTNIKEALPPLTRVLFTLTKEKKGGDRVERLQPGDLWLNDLLARFTPSDRPKLEITGGDRALFQYSGGTTGEPKAAVALHRNLVANILQIKAWLHDCKEGGETSLVAMPLFHVYAMVAGMGLAVAAAGRMVLVPNPRDLDDLFASINRYQPTLFPGVPRLYNSINNHPDVLAGKVRLGSIRACISGSAPLLLEIKTKFEKLSGGKLFEGYGMSETPTATHCNPFYGKNKEGSIGLPLPDVEAKVISLDDGLTPLGPNEVGELVIRGPQVMWGYHNDPTGTANVLRDLGDGGGKWLFTGDIVRMDEDGYFYIVDRKKELIKAGGFQVWPRDVEEVVAANPKVLEVGVAGIPHPQYGETVKAWVVLKPGETATAEEIKAWCKDKLVDYKIPREIEFRPELPKTQIGKILRRELVRQHKEQAVVR